jgi:hypothetical protein
MIVGSDAVGAFVVVFLALFGIPLVAFVSVLRENRRTKRVRARLKDEMIEAARRGDYAEAGRLMRKLEAPSTAGRRRSPRIGEDSGGDDFGGG